MLTSLFENNKKCSFNVYLQGDNISKENTLLLESIARRHNSNISIINVDSASLPKLPIREGDHVSVAAYYRLLSPYMLPLNINKVLYLDCDIIINGDIEQLFNEDISEYACAAIIDEDNENPEKHKRLGYGMEYPYINSGVMLINIEYWRKKKITERCMEFIRNNPDRVILHDQDTINAVLNKEIKLLSVKYNLQTAMLYCCSKLSKHTTEDVEQHKYKPIIIHYTGASKPWHKGSKHPYCNRFLYYKNISAWRKYPLVKSERTWKEELLYFRNSIIWALGLRKRPKTYIINKQD